MALPGAGDIAHVYLLEQGPCLAHEETDYVSYDDATQQLLAVKGGHVFAYDVSAAAAGGGAGGASGGDAVQQSLKWMYPLQEGPPVVALRPSLDNRLLAVQRGPALLELIDLASGRCYVHSAHQGRGAILAFFFSEARDADVVIVTTRGVEMTQFAAGRQGLRCRERIRGQHSWAVYTHETRMVVVGGPGAGLAAWQFASHGTTHLPLFELQGAMPASAAVHQFLPSAAAAATAQQQQQQAAAAAPLAPQQQQHPGTSRPPLSPERVWLLKIYGRVYLAVADPSSRRLELYRFYTDTIMLQHVYELASPQVQLSVVDNVLLMHHPDAAVAVLFDVALPQSSPIANPLPLRKLQLLPPALAAVLTSEERGAIAAAEGAQAHQQQQQQQGGAAAGSASTSGSSLSRAGSRTLLAVSNHGAAAAAAAEAQPPGAGAGDVYEASEVQHSGSWRYYMPCVILDADDKSIGRLQLDLQAVADSAEDWPALTAFLMRRRPLPPGALLAADPRALLMQVARSALQERLGLRLVRRIFDALVQAYADAVARTAAHSSGPAVAVHAAAADSGAAGAARHGPALLDVPAVSILTPHELARDLFQWVHEEEVVDALYLQAAVSEYSAASQAVGVAPPPYLQLLAVDLLLQQQQHYQAVQLLYCQPSLGSPGLAQHLLDVARKDAADGGVPPAAAPGAAAAGFDASPGAAMALELAVDVLARQAVPEVRPPASAAAAGGGTATAAARASTAALVRQLLSMGQVLAAARVARSAGGVSALQVPPAAFLEAAAGARDYGAFMAAYRVLRPHLVATWPELADARAHYWDGGASDGGASTTAATTAA